MHNREAGAQAQRKMQNQSKSIAIGADDLAAGHASRAIQGETVVFVVGVRE